MRISDWSSDVCSSDLAPIVYRDSIDMDICWMASRGDKVGPEGDGKDYNNCPLTKEKYLAFHQGLLDGDKTEFRQWEKDTLYFESSMPIVVQASCGVAKIGRAASRRGVGRDVWIPVVEGRVKDKKKKKKK